MRNYTESDIKTLGGLEHIRLRPSLYISDTETLGLYQLVKEIIGNSVDEIVQEGATNKRLIIEATATTLSVEDFGRGIPLNSVFDVSAMVNTGSKFDKDKAYSGVQTGLHGVGLKVVNSLSKIFIITSRRSDGSIDLIFDKGILQKETRKNTKNKITGTKVYFELDSTIFDLCFDYKTLKAVCEEYAYLIPGIKIQFKFNDIVEEFKYNKGLRDKFTKVLGEETKVQYKPVEILTGSFSVIFSHIDEETERIISYANYVLTNEGGVHVKDFKGALTAAITELAGSSLNGSDIRSGLVAIISILDTSPKFAGHTKTYLSGTESSFNLRFKEAILVELQSNKSAIQYIVKHAILLQEQRERSKALKANINEAKNSLSFLSSKLSKCISNKPEERQLLIVEGDSAGGTVKRARDRKIQAVYSLKGKPPNAAGLTRHQALENQELFGLAYTLNILDDTDNLSYHKIILMTDADFDGYHIQNLLLTFLGKFYRTLLDEGCVYILQTPLYKLTYKDSIKFAYSDAEKDKILSSRLKVQPVITRHKGLGEMSVIDMQTILGTAEKHLTRILIDDGIDESISFFCGKNTTERRDLILSTL
jgi:DNA gyrase/topoisomerase IV subunit B